MRCPGVDREAAFPAHAGHICAVENRERESEARFHLVAPLLQHRRRAGDDDAIDPPAEQQLARDQARLDRLAEADIVGDEEVDARQTQRLAQGCELVRIDMDACAERRLKEVRVGRRHAVPGQGAEVGGEQGGIVEALARDGPPSIVLQHPGVQLVLPEHHQWLALGIVVEAGQVDEGGLALSVRLGDFLDEVPALADECDPARFRR